MRRRPQSHRLHHIYRLDYAKTYRAWVVRWQALGKVTLRNFNDRHYGSKKQALAAAIRFRDTVLKKQHLAAEGLWRRSLKRRTNVSGIVGVGKYVRRHRKDGRLYVYHYWQAQWYADGKHHRRRFRIAKFGAKRAKELAIRARAAALREIYGPLYQEN